MVRYKVGDKVKVIIGKDKGKVSEIEKLDFSSSMVFVKDVNVKKRHTKMTQDKPGGILDKTCGINISNVVFFCEKCESKSKIIPALLKDNVKVRKCKACGEVLK
jgi:large subunit ribosomal protein L24